MINQHRARHKDEESKFTCVIKLQRPSTTGLSSAGGGAINIRGAPSMPDVRSATRVAGGEVVGRGRSPMPDLSAPNQKTEHH
jgi:hypothetical protein